jgi:hypothetical protein
MIAYICEQISSLAKRIKRVAADLFGGYPTGIFVVGI